MSVFSETPQAGKSGIPGSRFPVLLVIGTLLLLAALELSCKAFSTFWFYDDQGYIMLSLKQYREGYPLYDTVFSQYGPAYYIFRNWCYGGAIITHDFTAANSVGHAWLCCLLVGVIIFVCTRSLWCAALGLAIIPSRVVAFFNEAGHPQEFQCVLVLLATLAVVCPVRPDLRACLLGFLTGVIAMVKINVGVLMLLPLLLFFVRESPRGKLRSLLVAGLVFGFLISPFVLMRKQLTEVWVFAFAYLASAALAPVLLLTASDSRNPRWRPLLLFCLGLGVTVGGILAIELSRGTTTVGLLRGILLQPLALSTVYVEPFPIGYPSIALATISLFYFYLVWRQKCSATVLCLSCLVFGVALCLLMLVPGARFFTKYLTPFIWLVPAVRMIRGISSDEKRPAWQDSRYGFVFVTAVFLILQSYPVAGTQVSCGTILFPIVGILALFEGLIVLRQLNYPWHSTRRQTIGIVALAVICLGWRVGSVAMSVRSYRGNAAADLPGMTWYRLPPDKLSPIRWMVRGLERFDTFVCLPGFSSLYFWCRKEPPSTYNNTGTWMTLLDDETQQKVVSQLHQFDSLGGMRWRQQENSWAQGRDLSARPLVKFIDTEMRKFDEHEGFELLERVPAHQ